MPRIDPEVLPYWAVLAVLALVAIVVALYLERRGFAIRGKGGAWLVLRLASLPIVAVTAAAVVFPARTVSGMEGLAAFYLLLVTAGPAVYFGLHWLVGRIAGLAGRESMGVALVGLAILLGPPLLAQFAQNWVWEVARLVKEAAYAKAPLKPFPYALAAKQRFELPGVGEVWTEHWQAPAAAGVEVERIEFEIRGRYARVESANAGYLCRSGRDFHVLWLASVAPPRWRVYWQDGGTALARSDWNSGPPQGPVQPFALQWLPDGFVLPARIPRGIATLGRAREGGSDYFDDLHRLQAGETFADSCLPLEYRRVNAANETPITALGLRLWNWETQQTLRAVLRRPDS